ncbi:MAG: hypothetical protein QM757_12320 [Paludibaculum sp.]
MPPATAARIHLPEFKRQLHPPCGLHRPPAEATWRGFTASLQYTFSKSIDNASLGGRNQSGPLIAQNWLDLRAERALSNFDQRHTLSALMQYTTGMGLRGGALAAGKKSALLKD